MQRYEAIKRELCKSIKNTLDGKYYENICDEVYMFNVVKREYMPISNGATCMLVADIGGTNCNFGIAQIISNDAQLLFSMHYKSKEIVDFTQIMQELLCSIKKEYGISIKSACLAAAGVVTPKQTFCKPTNLHFTIDAKKIMQHTDLSCVFLVNDFEVVGYGIDRLDKKDLVNVQTGNSFKHGNKAILGAGTGLGKAILRYIASKDRFIPVASEGGHADFAAQTDLDMQFIHFIKKSENHAYAISWEHVLSGNGIKRIYDFLGSYKTYDVATKVGAHDSPHPDQIAACRLIDQRCQDTFQLYSQLYGRCAKDWALNALALGGIYIAGGIAAHNISLFEQDFFLKEFANCAQQHTVLKSIPIWVIADYNVSLYGAIEYMRLEGKCEL